MWKGVFFALFCLGLAGCEPEPAPTGAQIPSAKVADFPVTTHDLREAVLRLESLQEWMRNPPARLDDYGPPAPPRTPKTASLAEASAHYPWP